MIRDWCRYAPLYYTFTYLFLVSTSMVWYSSLLFIFFLLLNPCGRAEQRKNSGKVVNSDEYGYDMEAVDW